METNFRNVQLILYTQPLIEVYVIETCRPLAGSPTSGGFDGSHEEGNNPNDDILEAKQFGFDETWDGAMWE